MKQTYAFRRILATAVAAGVLGLLHPYAAQAVDLNSASFEIPDSSGIKMIRIQQGQFKMGSPESEPGRWNDERQRLVTISKPFFIAETEITQEQYIPTMLPDYKPFFVYAAAFELSLPEVHQSGPFHTASRDILDSSKHPMEGVEWDKAVEFCRKITQREKQAGRLPAGYEYRLPTEAEWEYACRAGTSGLFNLEGDLKGFSVGPYLELTSTVKGSRKPNAWGLYDMHGNVYEWCLDWYGPYEGSEATDPTGPRSGERRVARGGCYLSGKLAGRQPDPINDQRSLRSAARGKFQPDFPLGIVGFRMVLAPEIAPVR